MDWYQYKSYIHVRRIGMVCAAIVMLVLFADCKRKGSGVGISPPADGSDSKAVTQSTTIPTSDSCAKALILLPKIGVENLRFGMTPEEVVNAWGVPDHIVDGGDTTYYYPQHGAIVSFRDLKKQLYLVIVAHPNNPNVRYWGANFQTGTYQTPEGIGFLATEAQICAQYGEPDYKDRMDDGRVRWEYKKIPMLIMLYDGKCVGIGICGVRGT